MSPVHEHVASLLGAWALGACSDAETRLIMDHLPRCDACMEESLLLGGAAAMLSGIPPAPSLRERTLAGARARRPPAPSVPPYAAPYAAQVSLLDALLTELPNHVWSTHVVDGWNVQDVIAHLTATDGILADQLEAGAVTTESAAADALIKALQTEMARASRARRATGEATEAPGPDAPGRSDASGTAWDVDARTALVVEREREHEPPVTRAAWRAQAEALCARLADAEAAGYVSLKFPMRVASAAVQRAFETWIHTRDIALATNRSLPLPLPHHLHAMASLGVRALPAALTLTEGRPADGESVHVDLKGPGGGAWDLPLGSVAPDTPSVTMALDAMDFCLLAGGRLHPNHVQADLAGDVPLGQRLLAAVPAFAGP